MMEAKRALFGRILTLFLFWMEVNTEMVMNAHEASRDELARELLQAADAAKVPVDLLAVAKHLGIRVYEGTFKNPNISGMFFADPTRVPAGTIPGARGTIVLNKAEAAPRKRFTLAHELGHFVLEHPRSAGVTTEFYRGTGAPYNPAQEREANQFAASLLMPKQAFKKALDAGFELEHISVLFGVSAQAAAIRAQQFVDLAQTMR